MPKPLALAIGLLVFSIPAAAQDGQPINGAAALVSQFEAICLANGSDVDGVRGMAEDNGWEELDPATLPARSRVSIQRTRRGRPEVIPRTHAWKAPSGAFEVLIGLTQVPAPLKSRCEVMAYGDDADSGFSFDSVDRQLAGLRGVTKSEPLYPGLPTTYVVRPANIQFTYLASDAGSRLLHYIFTN